MRISWHTKQVRGGKRVKGFKKFKVFIKRFKEFKKTR